MKSSSSIISPLHLVFPESRVSSIIDFDLGLWKSDLVQQFFLPHEASLILGIPFSRRSPTDRVVCAHTPSDMFSTSSAYKLLAASITASNARSSSVEPQKQFWRGIWWLCVPNKIKHFIWRACNNALPTKSNLFQRQITTLEGVWSAHNWFQQFVFPLPLNLCDLLNRFLLVHDDFRKEIFAVTA